MLKKISLFTGALIFMVSASFLITCKKTSDSSTPTTPTDYCTDGKQDNGEAGVDCGGTCSNPCPAAWSITATINGVTWSAVNHSIYKGNSFTMKAGSGGVSPK